MQSQGHTPTPVVRIVKLRSKQISTLLRCFLIASLVGLAAGPAFAGNKRVVKKSAATPRSYKAKAAKKVRAAPVRAKSTLRQGRALRAAQSKIRTPKRTAASKADGIAKATKSKTLVAKQTTRPRTSKASKSNKGFRLRDGVREFQQEFDGDRSEVLASQAADKHISKVMRHSERNGQYHIVSDLHWGKGRLGKGKGAKWDPQEDFRKSESFSKFVGQIAKSKRNVSLVIGGDWLELMEHVDANAPIGDVKDRITKIIEGHSIETKALTSAVTNHGLRLVYLAGNHDVHLVDARVRDHLVSELARVGGVPANKRGKLAERVGYSGHGAVLGRFGEGMVVHGHAQDASNNWRSVLNPYNAKRELQSNLGWNIVARLYRSIEKRSPEIDNIGKSSTKSVAKKIFSSPRHIASALGVVWSLLGQTRHFGRAGKLSEKLDDRRTMRAWEARTGFAEKMRNPIPGAKPNKQVTFARTIESIYQGAPSPLHETMRTPSRIVNFLVTLFSARRSMQQVKNSEPTLLSRMTGELTNVRYVVWGHNHKEAVVTGNSAKGELGHYNTGTWTKVESEWRLNVVSGRTNGDGRLKMDGVFRTELATGKPTLPNSYDKSLARPVPGWQ